MPPEERAVHCKSAAAATDEEPQREAHEPDRQDKPSAEPLGGRAEHELACQLALAGSLQDVHTALK